MWWPHGRSTQQCLGNSQSLARLPFHLNRFLSSSGSFSSVISASSAVLLPCVETNIELSVDLSRTLCNHSKWRGKVSCLLLAKGTPPTPTATSSASTATRSLGGLSFRLRCDIPAVTGPCGNDFGYTRGGHASCLNRGYYGPVSSVLLCCVFGRPVETDFLPLVEARHSKVNDTVWMATQAYLLLYNTAQVR